MKKTVKAWAVINKNGGLRVDDFYCDERGPLAIFKFGKVNSKHPMWGYAVYPEKEVQVTITYQVPRRKK